MRPKIYINNKLQRIKVPRPNFHMKSSQIQIPKNSSNIQSIDIYIHPSNSKSRKFKSPKQFPQYNSLVQYQQQYRLPVFQNQKNNSHSIDVNQYKQRRRTLESRPGKAYKIKFNNRSKSIATNLKDTIYENFIKKQFRSLDAQQLPQTSIISNILDHKYLTSYQKEEIKMYKDVYYIGHKAYLRKYQKNFRDSKNNYKALIGDHIAYRFQIIKILGEGAFGKVLEVFDHKTHKKYALKITKMSQELHHQFILQMKILKVCKKSPSTNKNIVQIKGDFQFRGHLCMVTQILSMNLYNFIKGQNFVGLQIDVVRKVMIQVLQSLVFLHHKGIIHCDIKPENVCFKQLGKSGVKLIDFGSACYYAQKQFTYIQSRYYRSPQIVLVKPYNHKIDIWSVGCMAYQLYTGTPLFPSRSQNQQMKMLTNTLGIPSQQFLNKCQRGDQFTFTIDQSFRSIRSKLKDSGQQNLISFIQSLVKWSPQERLQAKDALLHQFILSGLPQSVISQHINQMQSKNPYDLYS